MKIKTWVKYMEAYLPTTRCRKNRYKEMEEYINIELKEISMNDIKPAFNVDGIIYYLFNDEELFVKANKRDISAFDIENPLENLKHCNENCSSYFGFNNDDSKEKMINKANEEMKQFLLIDEELYIKTSEPRYVCMTFGLGNNHAETALLISNYYNSNISSRAYFNALERDKAIEKALTVAINRGDTKSIESIKDCSEIKILIPKAVHCNPKIDCPE